MTQNKLEVICQKWFDTDQSAGFSFHRDFKSWGKYRNETVEGSANNHYPFEPVGEPMLVYVSKEVEDRVTSDGTVVFGYDYFNLSVLKQKGILLEILNDGRN